MTSEKTKWTLGPFRDDLSNDLKILVFVFAAAMVCMGFMLLAGASASAAAAAWG